MRPTQILRSGGDAPLGKYNKYVGYWGEFGGRPQKGIITYGLSPNRQNPFAGAAHDAIFNTWRRASAQVLYIAPPFIAAYYLMNWATERNEYLNSKAGRAEFGGEAE
ncbi:cytochrome b-c1 complex subunit 8 [Phialemonium atrogriseum]|uniref:Cytochrome b-c1 complex subunit 8 n=1 Tax=Phialemonium atrogriseum TaxID=1093897 RepID=A0AAJ0C7F4_9PEZI|nr:cytochrome b-c1 complex subunit 8 [Phialemonium atrogriseum]KAK1770912.1 cytochrome b-c1 complex subunit 8 [Phialemonium atrogriseum]